MAHREGPGTRRGPGARQMPLSAAGFRPSTGGCRQCPANAPPPSSPSRTRTSRAGFGCGDREDCAPASSSDGSEPGAAVGGAHAEIVSVTGRLGVVDQPHSVERKQHREHVMVLMVVDQAPSLEAKQKVRPVVRAPAQHAKAGVGIVCEPSPRATAHDSPCPFDQSAGRLEDAVADGRDHARGLHRLEKVGGVSANFSPRVGPGVGVMRMDVRQPARAPRVEHRPTKGGTLGEPPRRVWVPAHDPVIP